LFNTRIKTFAAIGILTLSFYDLCQAQNNQSRAVFVGLKLDLQASGIANQNNYGQNEMDYKATLGFGIGGVVTYALSPVHAILLEVSYQSGGQKYDDRFKGRFFKKEISHSLISIPVLYRYRLSREQEGYAGIGGSKPIWYVLGGLQIDRILSPEITWYLDDSEVEFLEFVLEGGNPNQQQIEEIGAPASDDEFFTKWDGMFVAGGGFQLPINQFIHLSLELRGGIGLTDINADSWKLKNNKGIYQASRLAFFGLHTGIHIQLANP